jgi:uncharacterized protein YbaP (TraB family)
MKHKLWFLLLLCSGFLHAQPLEKSLLWKISGNGITMPSYLFGTIHLTCDATLDQNVKNAMDQTRQLYLEIDMDDDSLQASMMKQMMMDGGKKLSDLATKDDYATVDAFVKQHLGMPLEVVNTVKPIFISVMLMQKLADCPPQSVEKELMSISQLQHEPVSGLETVDEQMKALNAIPYQEQMDELVKSAKSDLKTDKKELEELFATYKTRDIEGMLKLSQESENTLSAKYENQLLTIRNSNWVPRITAVVIQKPTLFAVGAAHLAGDEGVIKLLRKAGFTVVAVK